MNRILFLGGLHRSEGELNSTLSPPCFSYNMWHIYLMRCGSARGRNRIVCLGRDEKIKFGLTICGGNNLI